MINQFRLDPVLALVLVLSLFAALPLALNPGLPASAHLAHHQALATELAQNLRAGRSVPVAADIGLAHLLSGSMHLLLGFNFLDAWRCLIMLSFLCGGGGIYLFCRRRCGRLGAAIAGLLFVCSPGLMYNLAYARGAYPELLALAVFPVTLWRLDALRDKPSAGNFMLAVAMQALLIASDTGLAPGLTTIALVWIVLESLIHFINREASRIDSRSDGWALLALLLGVLAAALFWAPPIGEGAAMKPLVDASAAFASLADPLSPPPLHDAGAINGLREIHILGPAQTGLALLGIAAAALMYSQGYRTRHPGAMLGTLVFTLIALVLVALTASPSRGWGDTGLWPQLQHSPGLLGAIVACLAIVAGANGFWLERLEPRFQISLGALLVALPMLTAIPLLYVPEWRYHTLDALIESQPFQDLSAVDPGGGAGAVLSAGSLLAAGAAAWMMRTRPPRPRPYLTAPALARPALFGIALGAVMTGLALPITYREGVAWLNSPPGEALPAQVRLDYSFDGVMNLLGYDLEAKRLKAGESIVLRAYWHAPEATPAVYASFLHLHGAGMARMQVINAQPGDGAAAAGWRPEGYVLDRFALKVPADAPPGEYKLDIGLFLCAAPPPSVCDFHKRASVEDALGRRLGDSVTLTSIRVDAR